MKKGKKKGKINKNKIMPIGIGSLIMSTSIMLSGCGASDNKKLTNNEIVEKDSYIFEKEKQVSQEEKLTDIGEKTTGVVNENEKKQDDIDIALNPIDASINQNVSIYASAMSYDQNVETQTSADLLRSQIGDNVTQETTNTVTSSTLPQSGTSQDIDTRPETVAPIILGKAGTFTTNTIANSQGTTANTTTSTKTVGTTTTISTGVQEIVAPIVLQRTPTSASKDVVSPIVAPKQTVTPTPAQTIAPTKVTPTIVPATTPKVTPTPTPAVTPPMAIALYAAYMEEPTPTSTPAVTPPMAIALYAAYMEEPTPTPTPSAGVPAAIALYAAYPRPTVTPTPTPTPSTGVPPTIALYAAHQYEPVPVRPTPALLLYASAPTPEDEEEPQLIIPDQPATLLYAAHSR